MIYLNAKIEELQQEAVRVKSQLSSRDNYMERRFLAQEREINTLRHKGCQFCKPADSAPKHAKRSFKYKQTVPVTLEAEVPAVPEPARLTTEVVISGEMDVDDITDASVFQARL